MRLIEIDIGKYESESLKINHRDIEEIIAEIEKKAREEFAHELKELFNQEFPSNYVSTRPYFTLDNVRALVDIQLKEKE